MRTPTENTYDIVLGVCVREPEWDPPWCKTHVSGIHGAAKHCDRRLVLQRTVERVLKAMEGEGRDKAVIESQREMIRALTIELMKANATNARERDVTKGYAEDTDD